jgi:cell division protein FtsW (lipid II flippase)
MKDRVTSVLASTSTGLTTALAGARWWAVLLVVLVVLGSTYGAVCWLATHSKANRITTFLITWEREREPEPSKPPDSS